MFRIPTNFANFFLSHFPRNFMGLMFPSSQYQRIYENQTVWNPKIDPMHSDICRKLYLSLKKYSTERLSKKSLYKQDIFALLLRLLFKWKVHTETQIIKNKPLKSFFSLHFNRAFTTIHYNVIYATMKNWLYQSLRIHHLKRIWRSVWMKQCKNIQERQQS